MGPFVAAGAGLLAFLVLFTVGPRVGQAIDVINVSLLGMQLDGAAVAIAALAGVLCLVRWRVAGEAAALWLGIALLVYGLITVGLGTLLTAADPAGVQHEVLATAHPASRIAVLWLLYRALRTPEVDAGLRPWPALFAAAGLIAGLTVVFQLLPGFLPVFASAGDLPVTDTDAVPAGASLLVLAWLGLGATFGFRGVRTRRWLYAWFGLMFFALAFAELAQTAVHPAESVWLVGTNALRFLGVLFAAVGATRELVRAFQEQQIRLLETVKSEKSKEARLQAGHRALEELAHEARNALTGIEGATRTLEHYRERLDDDTRAGLTQAISREIARLQALISPDRVRSSAGEFRLRDAVMAIAAAARSHDVTVHVDIPEQLTAFGHPAEIGQVVQNLVENARRYAPHSPIYLRAEKAPTGVVLRVEDEGPGVPPEERQSIFERGRRGSTSGTAEGTGLGLYVSARLMREQGGELWVDARPGGGASFALWLPTDQGSALEKISDQTEHAVQTAQITPLFRLRRPKDANGVLLGAGRDDHHNVRSESGR